MSVETSDAAHAKTATVTATTDSLRKRYVWKVVFNLVGLPIGLGIQAIVPRALGPAEFGNFSFVTSFFTSIVNFFDAGTSTKLYHCLCQRPNESAVLRFYWYVVAITGALLLAFVGLGLSSRYSAELWPAQTATCVWLGAAYSLGIWVLAVAGRVIDAYGLTVAGEAQRFLQKVITIIAVAGFFFAGVLHLTTYLGLQIMLVGLLVWLWSRTLHREGRAMFPRSGLMPGAAAEYSREFWNYSFPLLGCGLVATFELLADRWLLQQFGSSIEQGLYSLSYQVGALCFLFSGAVVPLLAREFSQAHAAQDERRLAHTFSQQIPRFYALAAFFGVFFASQADGVALLFGGHNYVAASIPMALMCLYPVHQTYGQLTASVFFATGRTIAYRNIGVCFSVAGICLTYFMLAPSRMGGLGLGSTGLALKMVVIQAAAVNVKLWYCIRQLRLRPARFFVDQIAILAAFGLAAAAARLLVSGSPGPVALRVAVAGLLYTGAVGTAIWTCPQLIHMTRDDIQSVARAAAAWLKLRRASQ